MIIELIALIILILSLGGILIILYRKIPALIKFSELIEDSSQDVNKRNLILELKARIKDFIYGRFFLQRILCKIKILTLKFEKLVDNLLQKLRKKSKENLKKKNNNQNAEVAQ